MPGLFKAGFGIWGVQPAENKAVTRKEEKVARKDVSNGLDLPNGLDLNFW